MQVRSRTRALVRRKPIVLLLQALLCGAAVLPLAHAQGSAQHAARSYQVSAGPLEDALNSFARQAGITLSFPPALVKGRQSSALKGEFAVNEGLQRLLAPHRLEALRSSDGSYVLRELPQASGRTELPPVLVTANADTGEVGTVRAATLERYQARDLEDVFASQADVSVGGGHGIAEKVYVRGIQDTLLNVSIDGASQAGQAFHHTGRINIEPELLNRVEVQAGTGDATAGAGALGGAIRFVTKDPAELLRNGQRIGALLKADVSNNGSGYKANATVFGHLSDQWSAMFSQTSQDHDDYRDGEGRVVANTAAKQTSTFAKLVGKLTADQTLRLSYDRFTDKGDRTQRPQWVESSFNPAYPMRSTRETWTLGYNWTPDNRLYDVAFKLYQTSTDIEQDVTDRWGLYTGKIKSTGLDLRNTSRFGMHTLTFGVDHRRDHITAGYGSDTGTESEIGSVSGLYIQDSMALTPKLVLGLGGRYDNYRLTDNNDQGFKDSGFSPNASLRYNVTPALALLAGHARALRGPKVRDAFKLEGSSNDPNLQAEKARTSEVGAEYAEGALRLGGKLYRTHIDNAIADPLYGPIYYTNIGNLKTDGVLLHAAYDLDKLSMSASINHSDSTLDGQKLNAYDHNGLGTSLGDRLVTTVDYRHSAYLGMGWLGRFVRGIDNLETSAGAVDKPGYAVHDVYARWRPTGKDDWTITLTIKNLFDKNYLDQASNENFQHIPGYAGFVGSREPGREIRLGVAARF